MSLKQQNGGESTSLVLVTLLKILYVPFWVSFLNIYVNKCILFWVPLIGGGKLYSNSEVTAHKPYNSNSILRSTLWRKWSPKAVNPQQIHFMLNL